MNNTQKSHTGGQIIPTRTGIIHRAGRGYGGLDLTEDGENLLDVNDMPIVKRGPGRPPKRDIRVNLSLTTD